MSAVPVHCSKLLQGSLCQTVTPRPTGSIYTSQPQHLNHWWGKKKWKSIMWTHVSFLLAGHDSWHWCSKACPPCCWTTTTATGSGQWTLDIHLNWTDLRLLWFDLIPLGTIFVWNSIRIFDEFVHFGMSCRRFHHNPNQFKWIEWLHRHWFIVHFISDTLFFILSSG